MILSKKKLNAFTFLSGIFISSVGSTAFMIGLMVFPLSMGISAAVIGVAIGASRLTSVLVNFFGGPIGDKIRPQKIILLGEFGALIGSIAILITSRNLTNESYLLFVAAIAMRSAFTGIQSASVQKVGKLFDDELVLAGGFAKYLNKATFGAIFFAMIVNIVFIKYGNFSSLIIFDALTFLINGILLLISINPLNGTHSINKSSINIFRVWEGNKLYFTKNRSLAFSDIALALVMMGANTLNVVLLLDHPHLIPYASGIFGLAVWLSTPIQSLIKINDKFLWFVLGFSIAAQGFLGNTPVILLFFSFFRNISYWILYNHISAELMRWSSKESFAGISSGRLTAINIIGSMGEFWVGLKLFPIFIETLWRGTLSAVRSFYYRKNKLFTILLILMTFTFQNKKCNASELNIPLRSLVINTDPQQMVDTNSLFINRQIYRGLMKYTTELELEKDLALSFEVLDSGKKYIFHLAKNMFSDNTPITSKDVVATFRRMLKIKSSVVADLHSIKGFSIDAAKLNENLGINAITDSIVEFKLNFADPFFIKNLAAVDCSIIKLNAGLDKIEATSGKFSILERGTALRLKQISTKSEKSPLTVNFIKIDSDEDAIFKAKKGSIDTLETVEVPEVVISELEKTGWKSFKGQIARLLFFSLNPNKLNLKTRKILFTEFNKRLPDSSVSPHYTATYGLIPAQLPGHLSQRDTSSLNVQHEHVFEKQTISISYPDTTELFAIANWAKKIISKHGYKVELMPFKIENYFKIIKDLKYDIILRSKYMDYPDGMAILTYFKSNLPINTFNAGSKTIDKAIEKTQLETSNIRRIEEYKKIQINLLKEYTLIPVYSGSTQSSLWSTGKVKSVKAHPMGMHSIYLDEIEMAD